MTEFVYQSEYGNCWTHKYTLDEAIAAQSIMFGCTGCIDCDGHCDDLKDCVNCHGCTRCTNCVDCVNCIDCNDLNEKTDFFYNQLWGVRNNA